MTATADIPNRDAAPIPRSKPIWLPYGDAIRVIGIIAVVVGHVCDMTLFSAKPLSLDWWVVNVWDASTRWAVPVFVMLSGALLLDPARSERPREFYGKRLARLGMPLVFWSAFFMWFSVSYTGWATRQQAWINLLRGQPYAHLHFIFRIAGLYAFTPMLRIFLRHTTRRMLIATVVLMFCLASADSFANAVTGADLSGFARFVPFLSYYLAGYLLREIQVEHRTLRWYWIGLITGIILLACGTGLLVHRFGMKAYPSMGMLLYDFQSPVRVGIALCAWMILVNLFSKPWMMRDSLAMRKLANVTLGLYLIHPIFRELLYTPPVWLHWDRGIDATWPNVWIGVPLVSLMVYVPSLILTLILIRIPFVKRFAGGL